MLTGSPNLLPVPHATSTAETARLDLKTAADLPGDVVLSRLGSSSAGLTGAEATMRLARFGPNALGSHGTSPWRVLLRQVNNPLLVLLIGAALVSGFTGDKIDATIIGVIVAMSVGLGFVNEFRSERAVEALHNQIRHQATVLRDAKPVLVDVTDVVPGDIATLRVGDIVPADMRLLSATELECDEGVLTGESMPSIKQVGPLTG